MDTVRSTLGPRGMDKLIFDGQKVTISNDGATIMKLLDIAHPAAKTLVDISMSQDAEVKKLTPPPRGLLPLLSVLSEKSSSIPPFGDVVIDFGHFVATVASRTSIGY